MSSRIMRLFAVATLVTATATLVTGCVATMPVTTVSEVTIRPKDPHLYQNGMYHYVIPGTNQFYTSKKKLRKPVTLTVTQQKMVPIMSAELTAGGPGPGYPPPDEPPPRREGPPPREEPRPERERPQQPPRQEQPRPSQRAPSGPPAGQHARPSQTAPGKPAPKPLVLPRKPLPPGLPSS
jgi:hypothetical protein